MYNGFVCMALCVELVLEVEGERGKKKTIGKSRKTKSYG